MSAVEIRPREGGSLLRLRVSPGASREGCSGVHDGALKLRVAAAPERGRANRAVLALLGRLLGLPVARLQVVRGSGSREKWVSVDGVQPDALRAALERILSGRGEAR